MTTIPTSTQFTSAPLRHRLRVELDASVPLVWSLVGDHTRLSEYSAGIERVELTPTRDARICHFRSMPGATDGIVLREHIRWEAPQVGYSTSAETPNDFGLTNDLSIVTIAGSLTGTIYTWEQYYDHDDLPMMRASFDEGLADIGQQLVARFGGRVVERYVDESITPVEA
jgi:hypothetical protein